MYIYDESNWYNNLSEAGKRATKLNILLARTQLNSKLEDKDIKNKDCLIISSFETSENNKRFEDDDDKEEIDIFSINKTNKKLKSKKNFKKINSFLKKKLENRKKYKYHDTHMQNMKKKEEPSIPSCTKYNPKYDSISRGIKSLPLWEKITGRIERKKEIFEHKFYLQHENIEDTMAGKTFIDMSKQILKRSFDSDKNNKEKKNKTNNIYNNNINVFNSYKRPLTTRIIQKDYSRKNSGISSYSNISEQKKKKIPSARANSAFLLKKKIKKKILNEKIKHFKNDSKIDKSTNINTTNINSLIDLSNNNIQTNNGINNSIDNKNKFNYLSKKDVKSHDNEKENDNDYSDLSTDSYDLFKHIYNKKKKPKDDIKEFSYNLKNRTTNTFRSFRKKKKQEIKAPDFKKCLSRESLNKLEDNKFSVTPYLLPNYESVRAKPAMMVVYNRKKHKAKRAKSASLLNLDNRFYYDENRALDNINNHISIHPPDFNMMTSRPIDNDPLPSYMKNIFDKNSCYGISAYSLKLNNYKNRDYTSFTSSFWPKISFNKVINLNLLKSKKFLDNIIFEENKNEIKNKIFGKALKFYNKNYEEILKEEGLPKFDNVTFKSYDKKKNIKLNELLQKIDKEI